MLPVHGANASAGRQPVVSGAMVALDTLAEGFRAFAETSATRAPLYRTLAAAVADDPEVLALLQVASDEQAIPVLLFAAVHHELLRTREPALARFYPNLSSAAAGAPPQTPPDGDAVAAFRQFTLGRADAIRATIATRHTQTNEVGRCALFLPALAALDAEMGPLSLVDVGASAGLNLLLDRFHYTYEPGGSVGPPSTVELTCSTRGAVPVPAALPRIAAAEGLDAFPVDLDDDDALRWLEACVWPDQTDRFERLVAAIELARSVRPVVRRGDAVDDLTEVMTRAAASGHPTLTTSWVLNYLPPDARRRFVAVLDGLGQGFDLSWVVAESPASTTGLPIPTTDPPEDLTVLSLVRWRDARRSVRRLATCHPHGYWMHWEAEGAI